MLVTAPLSKNHMATRSRWNITRNIDVAVCHIGFYRSVSAKVARHNTFVTERLVFKICPGQFTRRVEREARLGDVEHQLFGIAEVRSVADIPNKGLLTRAKRRYRPISRGIVGCGVPGFAIEATHMLGAFHNFAAFVVRNHTHKVVPVGVLTAGRTVISKGFVTLGTAGVIGFLLGTTVLLTRRGAFDIAVTESQSCETE